MEKDVQFELCFDKGSLEKAVDTAMMAIWREQHPKQSLWLRLSSKLVDARRAELAVGDAWVVCEW